MLDEQTNAKIQKAITESLPAQVGETLRKQLELIPILEKQLESSKTSISGLEKNVIQLKEERSELALELSKHQALDVREKIVSERERNSKLEELKYQLDAEKEKTQFSRDVALGLVRNTEYRHEVFGNKNIPVKDQFGNTNMMHSIENSTETNKAQ